MEDDFDRPRYHRRGPILAAVGGVLVWRVAALRWPSSFVDTPEGLLLPLALLGVLFLGCGLWAWSKRRDACTALFLLYALCEGIHWGGSVGAPWEPAEPSLFFVYLAATVLAAGALLHLALVYPRCGRLGRGWRRVLYAPTAIALALAAGAGLLSDEALGPAAGLLLLVANAFSLVAAVVFVVRLVRADAATRRTSRLPLIVTAIVAGSSVALLGTGGVLPGRPEAWNLALGAIPIALAVALVSRSPRVRSGLAK